VATYVNLHYGCPFGVIYVLGIPLSTIVSSVIITARERHA
jgi:hypothetical protein